ncbi:MAG: VCBS domain-containing protein [Parvularculales bacterium]
MATIQIQRGATPGQTFNGGAGVDTYTIHNDLDQSVTINDSGSETNNKIVFNTDVSVRRITEYSPEDGVPTLAYRVTLNTGAIITIYEFDNYSYSVNGIEYTNANFISEFSEGFGPANMIPRAIPVAQVTDINTPITFSRDDLGYSDEDGDDLVSITITQLPSRGTLTLNGVAVSTDQVIVAAEISNIIYTPANSQAAPHNAPYEANIQFTVNDGISDSMETTMAITVHAIAFTGAEEAYEDNPMRDPEGRVALVDTTLTGYALSVKKDADAATGTLVTSDNTTVALEYGTLTINLDGNWTYALNNNDSRVNALNGDVNNDNDGTAGTLVERVTFTYSRADDLTTDGINEAGTVNRTLDITIHGATDRVFSNTNSSYSHLTGSLSLSSADNLHPSRILEGGNGDDVFHGSAGINTIDGNLGDDWLFGYGGNDVIFMVTGEGDDVIDGGEGDDRLLVNSSYSGSYNFTIHFDLNDDVKWKFDASLQSWVSANSTELNYDDYTYVRMWIDSNGDGVADAGDEYNYITSIERLYIYFASKSDDVLTGGNGDDSINGHAGDDIVNGGGGNDRLIGQAGNDVLDGGSGVDTYVSSNIFGAERSTDNYSLRLNFQDTTRWKQDSYGQWTSGTSSDYTHIRVWYDLDDDGLAESSDEFDYITNFELISIYVAGGVNNSIIGGANNDSVISGLNNNGIYDGGGGNDNFSIVVDTHSFSFDFDISTRWMLDRDGIWTEGESEDHNYIRIWHDANGDGVDDPSDSYNYIRNFERFTFSSTGDFDDNIAGSNGFDVFVTRGGNDILKGRGGDDYLSGGDDNDILYGDSGNDLLFGGIGDDTLFGGAGRDSLHGSFGSDIYVLYQETQVAGEVNLDEVLGFFNSGTPIGSNDRIRVDTSAGNETTLEALKNAASIRWTQDRDYDYADGVRHAHNQRHINDTIIYDTNGTEFNTGDDIVLMVLIDYSDELALSSFEVV